MEDVAYSKLERDEAGEEGVTKKQKSNWKQGEEGRDLSSNPVETAWDTVGLVVVIGSDGAGNLVWDQALWLVVLGVLGYGVVDL